MTLRTVTYDDSTHKLCPIEPTGGMLVQLNNMSISLVMARPHEVRETLILGYSAMIAAAPEVEPIEMPEDLQRDWKGIDGAIAYHLIDRHADNWGDVGRMMDAWLKANQSAPEYQEPTKDDQC